MDNEVTFRSTAFNITEPREYFINECCFGDDLCRWLIAQLRSRGIETDEEPGQEDFGWYFNFDVAGETHCFVVGFQPEDVTTGEQWRAWLERDRGFLRSLLGARSRGVRPAAIALIDNILRSSEDIASVSWNPRE